MNKIPIYKPLLNNYKKSAIDAIDSEWISNHGKYINLATNKLREIINCKHVILMSNGTVATHCLFLSLKYKHPDIKKIYVPNNVYVAVYNCALMEYNIENLEILKINENTWNMEEDENYLLSLEKNSAIVIVHNVGGIIDVDRIKRIRPDVILVEDNCEGLFGKYNGSYTGSSNNVLCTSISFYGNKTITTGEGGAFLTNDDETFGYVKKIYTQGMSSIRFVHNVHAYNYRMTNVQAGFLYDQLNDIDTILNMKQKIFDNYEKILETEIKNKKIKLQQIHSNCERANWMFTIEILENTRSIEELNKYFEDNNVEIRPFFYPYHYHGHLTQLLNNTDNDMSKQLNKNIIMIPSYPELTNEEQIYISNLIKKLD
jgi:perosamine synthetase